MSNVEGRQLGPGSGVRWLIEGFALFSRAPLQWMMLAALWLLLSILLVFLPMVGQLVLNLLTPALGAGLMLGCAALERGGKLEVGRLIEGLRNHVAPLITIGGVYLVGNVLIFGVFMMLGGGDLIAGALEGKLPEKADTVAIHHPNPAPLFSIFLVLPLFMAVTFAPALVVFRGVAPLEAMKASFQACSRNLVAFVLFCVVALLTLMLAVLPYGLGMLVWVPVYACAVYRGYQDLFPAPTEAAPVPG